MLSKDARKQLGDRIATERLKKNWSLEKLAKVIGVSRNTIVNWESGRTEPTAWYLRKLKNLFSLSYEYLIEGNESTDFSISIRLSPTEREMLLNLMEQIANVK